ncbi:MAG: spermidine synthase [Elusimicrobia bacterium CG08_land_8_20_14_0_20_59_10]|nr:MAG: spermidine synthase [Elusimicrobia bacterium CG08_land_8_20_14_0_20_59_10]
MKKTRKPDWLKNSSAILPGGDWFVEFFTPGELHAHRAEKLLETSDTAFQKAALIRTGAFGEVLVIDGETQSSRLDEFFYHESLVCPALLSHRAPRTALVLGGGEGATAREILNSRGIESVVMADIDFNILRFARKHLGAWHKGAFDDPRLRLLAQDAGKLVENTALRFDLVYSDLPSPIKGGPAFGLYTLEFYRRLKKILKPDGIFTTHAGPGTPLQFDLHPALYNTLRRVFTTVRSYTAFIPSYDMPWSFLFCTDSSIDPLTMKAAALDRAASILKRPLRYLDGGSITGAFALPKYYKDRIRASRGIITRSRPMFFTTSQN